MNKSQVSLHKQQNNMVIMHMFTIAIPDLNPQPHKHIVKVTRSFFFDQPDVQGQ